MSAVSQKIVDSFQHARGNRPIFSEEVSIVEKWIQENEIRSILIEAIVSGHMSIDVSAGEVSFALTAEGDERGKELSETEEGQEIIRNLKKMPDRKPKELGELEERILMLLSRWSSDRDAPNCQLMSRIVGSSEESVVMAMASLKTKGMIQGAAGMDNATSTATSEWTPITPNTPPQGSVVMTRINDRNGRRNEQPLKRMGRLWFFPDGSMYVDYEPTEFRELRKGTYEWSYGLGKVWTCTAPVRS